MQYDSELTAQLAQIQIMFRQQRFADAVTLTESLARKYPEEPRVLAFAAEASQASGDLGSALLWIDKAIEHGDDPQHLVKKAWLLSQSLRRDEIPRLAEDIELYARKDETGLLFWQLGKLHYLHNRLDEAIECYRQALEKSGDRPDWLYNLATARFYHGDMERAEEDLEKLLEFGPQSGSALYLRSVLRKQKSDRNHVDDIRRRLSAGFQKQENEAAAWYALAKELEDLGEYEQSFSALVKGASKKRASIRYDVSAATSALKDLRENVDTKALAAGSTGHDESGAIFIVGMPRTGTTLALRMLLQSKALKDAGELMDFGVLMTAAMNKVRAGNPSLTPAMAAMQVDFAEIGRHYMRGARQMADGSPVFIDKMPVNYIYCGMIQKALPNARIIHLVRDPLDSCYAIFKTLFFNAYDFSYDQEELAEYYIAYKQLMRHWHEVMPGKILDVHYEDLVTDTEGQARRIYEWCGLPWTQDALSVPDSSMAFATASAAQVREPVHTRSVNSSRRHAVSLKPMMDRLAAAGMLDPSSSPS